MGLESRVEQLEGVLAEIKDEVSNTRSDLPELLDRLNGRGTEASPARVTMAATLTSKRPTTSR